MDRNRNNSRRSKKDIKNATTAERLAEMKTVFDYTIKRLQQTSSTTTTTTSIDINDPIIASAVETALTQMESTLETFRMTLFDYEIMQDLKYHEEHVGPPSWHRPSKEKSGKLVIDRETGDEYYLPSFSTVADATAIVAAGAAARKKQTQTTSADPAAVASAPAPAATTTAAEPTTNEG